MVLRRSRKRAEISFEPQSESVETAATMDVRDTALNPEQHYELRQRSECTFRAIKKLNITLRTPMEAWIERECSMKEVALALDLSLASVKSRLHRARRQLTCTMALRERASNAGLHRSASS